MLLHLIADFGAADLAFAEVSQRLKLHLAEAELLLSAVPPFSTLAAGFCAAQLGLNEAPSDTVIFHNVAPRRDDHAARPGNDGERLAYARLPNGVQVVGVNAGYAFSFLRDEALELAWVDVPSAGSQFRSRDLFPQALASVLHRGAAALAGTLEPHLIPAVPPHAVAYIDGFGNLKTTLETLPEAERVCVTIGEVTREVAVARGSFEVAEGELTLAPGSSGWQRRAGGRVLWLELFLRGGSAFHAFGCPPVGAEVQLEPR